MNLRATAKRWLVEAIQGVATLTIASTAVLILASGTSPVQSREFGPTVFAIGLALLTYVELKLLSNFESAQPWWFSAFWLEEGRIVAIFFAFVLPLAVSSLVNESVAAAFNPSGYWKSELAEARRADCSTYSELFSDSVEELEVAQNKYQMGIATSSEVKAAASGAKILRDLYQACQSTAQARVARARNRLSALVRE